MKLEPEKVGNWICLVGIVMLAWVAMLPPAYAVEWSSRTFEATCPKGYEFGLQATAGSVLCTNAANTGNVPAVKFGGVGTLLRGTVNAPSDAYAFYMAIVGSGAQWFAFSSTSSGTVTSTGSLVVLPQKPWEVRLVGFCPSTHTAGLQASPMYGTGCLNGTGAVANQVATTVMDAAEVTMDITCGTWAGLDVTSVSAHFNTYAAGMVSSCGYSDGNFSGSILAYTNAVPRNDTVLIRLGASIAGVFVFLIGLIVGWKMSVKPPQLLME